MQTLQQPFTHLDKKHKDILWLTFL